MPDRDRPSAQTVGQAGAEHAASGGGGRAPFRVLLIAMPDVASAFDRVMRIPNLGIVSLAANVHGAEIAVLDLVLHAKDVARAVREQVAALKPDLVGLSAMTFQYRTACQVAGIVRAERPEAGIVLGGYHASLAYDDIARDPDASAIDLLIRGEGEVPLNQLVQALSRGAAPDLAAIPGLSYRTADGFVHNAPAPLAPLEQLAIPDRECRRSSGFHYFGRPFDVVETSRGCPRGCRFCCIRKMYGSAYRQYPIERVIADIEGARRAGARGVFFSDDNINLHPERFGELCRAIVDAGLNDLEFVSQADVAGFARCPEVVAAMRRAGFSGVFLGIESVNPDNWGFLRKRNAWETTKQVVESLRSQGIAVAGGLIVGNPDDDAAAIRGAFRTARTLPLDHAIMWCLTPYPGTDAREDLLADGLVENPDQFERYNGFICNVRTRHLEHRELVRLIASEGLGLYLSPGFALRSRVWHTTASNVFSYYTTIAEYATKGYRNRLFESRHRL